MVRRIRHPTDIEGPKPGRRTSRSETTVADSRAIARGCRPSCAPFRMVSPPRDLTFSFSGLLVPEDIIRAAARHRAAAFPEP